MYIIIPIGFFFVGLYGLRCTPSEQPVVPRPFSGLKVQLIPLALMELTSRFLVQSFCRTRLV